MNKMNYREFKDAIAEQIHGFFAREVNKEDVHIFSVKEQDMLLDKFQVVGSGVSEQTAPIVDLHNWYKEYVNQYNCNFEDAIYYMARRYESLYHETFSKEKTDSFVEQADDSNASDIVEEEEVVVKEQEPSVTVEEKVPVWIAKIDTLIDSLEAYRDEEAKAISKLEKIVAEQERFAREQMSRAIQRNEQQMNQMQEQAHKEEEEKQKEERSRSR